MKDVLPTWPLSLRVKLVLSYLTVTLGAILILAFVVAIAVQSYFLSTQLDALHRQASYRVRQIEYQISRTTSPPGERWFGPRNAPDDPVLFALTDTASNTLCVQPLGLVRDNCNAPQLKQALSQSLQGKEVDGTLEVALDNVTVSSLYVSLPIHYNGQVVGAMFLSTPERYPADFLLHVNRAIFITGIVVSGIVVIVSFLLVRRLIHPLESLTAAAEQMKQGRYAQRVATPKTQDELGLLATTFNEMADTIEADVNELRRHEQIRRELIANIAHDLATPLTAIQGLSEALADDIITDATARQETAQRIGREVQRLRRLVADVQQMTSLESGHAHLDLAPLNLYTLVDETLAVIAPECEQMRITLQNEIAPSAPLVLADSDRITQVLLNLLDNARRHTPEGGTIQVGATSGDNTLHVWISDTGAGINAEDLPHIFERFYRADRSRSGITGGSGLGLSIVQAIITAHGGTIKAESTPGQGTRITFTLLLAPRENQRHFVGAQSMGSTF